MKSNLLITLFIIVTVSVLKGQMILEYNTNLSEGTSIILPLSGTVDVSVDWGDGNIELFTSSGNKDHTYSIDGIYTVEISGTLTHFGCNSISNSKLTQIIDFGNIGLTDLSYACYNANNLTQVPTQIPSTVTNLSYMFSHADIFNQDISEWDVSNVTDMSYLFYYAYSFNQPIGNWDVSNVTNMSSLFHYAYSFNQPIGNWDVSNVTNMSSLFYYAYSFNQPIGNWDVSNVTDMSSLFRNAMAFNQPIGSWDVGNVTNMSLMFCNADSFNQPIGNWDVSSVTDMKYMFYSNLPFNQNIDSWDVSNVTNMQSMFMQSGFNLKLGSWDVSNVTNMSQMFRRSNYDNDLDSWDVSNVTNMSEMFYQAVSFNKDISNWNVSNVTNMSRMFYQNYNFDQDIGYWDVSNVTNMVLMFNLVTLSTPNYDALLIGWSSQNLNPGIIFDGGYSQYSCAASAAHDILTGNPNNWIVTDGGYIEDEVDPTIICPSDYTIIADDESQTYTVQGTELDPLVFGDNCEGSFITNDFNSTTSLFNSVFNLGTTCVIWTVEDANGNQNTCSFNVTIETFTGIKDEYEKFFLLISPNPTNDYFTIDCSNLHENGDYSLKITNSLNQIVYSAPLENQQTRLNLSMQTSKGIYYVYLLDSDKQIIGIEKLVLQ